MEEIAGFLCVKADKLFVITKYLSEVCKKVSGFPANYWINRFTLIGKPELPERDNVAVASFNVVLHDVALLYTLYLLLFFLLAAYLKSVFLCNEEIGDGRRCNVVGHSHLIEKEGFANGSRFGILSS